MMAKVAWYIRKTFSGTVLASAWVRALQARAERARQRAQNAVDRAAVGVGQRVADGEPQHRHQGRDREGLTAVASTFFLRTMPQ